MQSVCNLLMWLLMRRCAPVARRRSRLGLAALVAGLLLAAPSPSAALSERDEADIGRIAAYLERIRTLRARFLQIAPDGALAEGLFLLKRPGRLRFAYAPPSPILMVADGTWLFFYDSELDQLNRIAIGSTPLSVLLAENIRFDGALVVERVERVPGVLRLVVVDRERPEQGTVTLVFSEPPLSLRQWLVKDGQGLVTTIHLSEVELNPPLDPQLFVFVDPNPFRDYDRH